jgi:hypothetical protein
MRVATFSLLLLVSAVGCASHRVTSDASNSSAKPNNVMVGPVRGYLYAGRAVYPSPSWPVYVALDYDKPGHPRLTDASRSKIRFVLRNVRPCQRSSVRYAFPGDPDEPIAVFFALHDVGAGTGTAFTHVIGEANAYYAPWSGEMRFGPIGADDPDSYPQKNLAYNGT